MTRTEWTQRVAAKQARWGGDLWNADVLRSRVFTHADVAQFTEPQLLTGLWADVRVTLTTGATTTRRYFA